MATAAELDYQSTLNALRTDERLRALRSVASASARKETLGSGTVRRAARRRMVTWGAHAIVSLGAPESLGITLLIGFLFDMSRVALTYLGPLVGIKDGWTELFVLKFWDGDLLDKCDTIMVFLELFAAVIVGFFLLVLLLLIMQGISDNPLTQALLPAL